MTYPSHEPEYRKRWHALYYRRNADAIKQKARDKYKTHRSEIIERNRKYAATHQDKIRAMRVRYWEGTRRDLERQKWMTPLGRAKKLFNSARGSARARGLEFTISIDDIIETLESGVCRVTGLAFDMVSTDGPWRPTIDRIDSSLGYIPGNVQIVVWLYNSAKQQYTHGDVMVLARALTQGSAS